MTDIASGAVELLVRVHGGGARPARDVQIDTRRDVTVEVLTRALAEASGVPASSAGHRLEGDHAGLLDPRTTVAASGLRHGDVLHLHAADAARADGNDERWIDAALVELLVTGGPEAGRRIPLAVGDHSVGRDTSCDVVIEDPSLSRRHLEVSVRPDGIAVRDLDSRNGTAIEGRSVASGRWHRVAREQQVVAGRTLLSVEALKPAVTAERRTDGGDPIVALNRPPRVARSSEAPSFALPAPPARREAATFPLGAAVLPLAMGVAFAVLANQQLMLLFAVLSPAMIGWNAVADRRAGKAQFRRAETAFKDRVTELRAAVRTARDTEVVQRRSVAPDIAELAVRATEHLPTLWERRRTDRDFLSLRLGTADQPSLVAVDMPEGGDPELRALAESVVAPADAVAVPVVVALPEAAVLGIAGPRERAASLARALLMQIAVLHGPGDVGVAACLAPDGAAGWDWLKWLPHCADEVLDLPTRAVAVAATDGSALVKALQQLVTERGAAQRGRLGGHDDDLGPAVVLLVDDRAQVDRGDMATLLATGPPVGVHALWLSEDPRMLPNACGAIAEITPGLAQLSLTRVASGLKLADAALDGATTELADEVARALAPVRDVSASARRATIPKRITLLELLGMQKPSAEAVAARWRGSRDGLRVPIGGDGRAAVTLDVRADGPHVLIAGTTGAGKSELLQTTILSLAASHGPEAVTFLLVDYKGGAAFQHLGRLPHVAGTVTDLDEHLSHRALKSLNAELKRRERLLSAAGAKDLGAMHRLRPAEAPASLLIVIDEFATLVKEIPAFVDGIVDVAQRGRSLGVHLVLATQRPSGVVGENIRGNVNARIALRVASDGDSEDVLGVRDAARIPQGVPGRALMRIGQDDPVRFQTAYVGARAAATGLRAAVTVRPFGLAPPSAGSASDVTRIDDDARESDLQKLVGAIVAAGQQTGAHAVPPPWLPPLADVVPLDTLSAPSGVGGGAGVIGLLDEPAHQRQQPLEIDFEQTGGLLVYGAPGSGKTTALRTLAAAFAQRGSADEVRFYGLDCASRALVGLEALPHCAGVVTVDDEDRVRRLLLLLRREIDERQVLLARADVFTLGELRRQGHAPPRLFLLLDSYGGFTAAYERVDRGELVDLLPRLVADGRPAGVHVIATADRRSAIPPAVSGVVPARLVLRMAEVDEYSGLGVDPRLARGAELPPGRGFFGNAEAQVALLGDDPSAEAQNEALGRLAARLSERDAGIAAPRLRSLPKIVDAATLAAVPEPWSAALGLEERGLETLALSLTDAHAVVAGPYRSGRSTALAVIARSVRQTTPGVRTLLVAPRRSPLPDLGLWDAVARTDEEIAAALSALIAEQQAGEDHGPVLLVLDDAGDLGAVVDPVLEPLVRRGRDGALRVAASFETTGLRSDYRLWVRELRKDGHGLLLDPNLDVDGDVLGVRLPRRSSATFPPGRGYAVQDGAATLVQIAAL